MRLLFAVLCVAAFTAANAYPTYPSVSLSMKNVGPGIVCPHGDEAKCPNDESCCSVDNTCCLKSAYLYGCCPLPNAFCCPDFLHCCPTGYVCVKNPWTGEMTCSKEAEAITFKDQPTSNSIICPDGQSQCPDGDTCCEMSPGHWGCCPVPDAVCCSDGQHCCPNGYTCDVGSGTCIGKAETIAIFKKQPALKNAISCPDGRSQCPDENTCCKLNSNQWGCCPSGYSCGSGTCTKEAETITMFKQHS